MYTSMTCRACSGVTRTGRSSATASRKWIVSAFMGPAYVWSTNSPGMDDIGSRMPCCIVFSTTSRWLSSTSRAPSVPTISIQVVEKFG